MKLIKNKYEKTPLKYEELKSMIETHEIERYYGYKDIDTDGLWARMISAITGERFVVEFKDIYESKYVEYFLKRDFKKSIDITPVPDNYVGLLNNTTISISPILRDKLLKMKIDKMSYDDVIWGILADVEYSDE